MKLTEEEKEAELYFRLFIFNKIDCKDFYHLIIDLQKRCPEANDYLIFIC